MEINEILSKTDAGDLNHWQQLAARHALTIMKLRAALTRAAETIGGIADAAEKSDMGGFTTLLREYEARTWRDIANSSADEQSAPRKDSQGDTLGPNDIETGLCPHGLSRWQRCSACNPD